MRPILPLLLFLLTALPALAQEYRWSDVEQNVTIRPDGVVEVDDRRTLTALSGDFGEAFICLDLERGQRVELLPDSGAVSPGPAAQAYSQRCEEGEGTELVVRNDRRVRERRVRFHYLLHGSVDAYADVVQWYWEILERGHVGIRDYRLVVEAPGPMEFPYDAFVHRFGNQELPTVRLSDDRSRLQVEFDRIPQGEGVEIRYLMDPALFTISGERDRMEALLRDEARIAGIQSVRRSPIWGVLGAVVLFGLGLGVYGAYRRHGSEPDLPAMRYPFEPPADLPPAAVSALLSQRFNAGSMGNAFSATVMDLARRNFGSFTGDGRKFSMRLVPASEVGSNGHLEPFEEEVLAYLRGAARPGDPHGLEFEELKRYSERRGARFISAWAQGVRSWIEKRMGGPLTTAESRAASVRWTLLSVLGGAGLFGLSTVVLGPARGALVVFAVLAVALAAVSLFALLRWRPEVAEQVYGWQGFRRTLADYTRMKDAPDDFFMLWDRYYCYAAALGVAERFLKNLRRAAPLRGLDEAQLASRGAWLTGDPARFSSVSDLSSVTRSISSLSSALSSASASASSGGSSSGGGGGGGGGSSGGR